MVAVWRLRLLNAPQTLSPPPTATAPSVSMCLFLRYDPPYLRLV